MKSIASAFNAQIFAREIFVTFSLTVLLLVTGCADLGGLRADLAPPPPVMAFQAEQYGPAVPFEIAMPGKAEDIEPAAGDAVYMPKCINNSLIDNTKFNVGFGDMWKNHDDALAFNNSYFEPNSAGMLLRLHMDLASFDNKKICR